jgi:hypothetical protein
MSDLSISQLVAAGLAERRAAIYAMHELAQRVNAAEHLDTAVRRLAAALDPDGDDWSTERLQTELTEAILDALAKVRYA